MQASLNGQAHTGTGFTMWLHSYGALANQIKQPQLIKDLMLVSTRPTNQSIHHVSHMAEHFCFIDGFN